MPVILVALGVGCGHTSAQVVEHGVQRVSVRGFAAQPLDAAELLRLYPDRGALGAGAEGRVLTQAGRPPQLGLDVLRAQAAATADQQFEGQFARTHPSEVVVLVGHNDNGVFRWPDGSTTDLRTMETRGRGLLAVISCQSDKFARGRYASIGVDVAFDVAYSVSERYIDRVRNLAPQALTLAVAQSALDASLRDVEQQRQVRIVATSGLAGTSAVGLTILWHPA